MANCIFKLCSLQIFEVLRILEIVYNDDNMSPSTILHIVESSVCKSVKKVPFGKFGFLQNTDFQGNTVLREIHFHKLFSTNMLGARYVLPVTIRIIF